MGFGKIASECSLPTIFTLVLHAPGVRTENGKVAVSDPQELVIIYNIFTVPGATLVTTPVEETVAIEVLELTHVPPVAVSISVVVKPGQSVSIPCMEAADGAAVTVILRVIVVVPQLPVKE